MTRRTSSCIAVGMLMLGLAACGKKPADKDVAKMDSELVGNATEADPALTSALQDQIMVDPNLTQQGAGRADNRRQAPIPPGATAGTAPTVSAPTRAAASSKGTLGELATIQRARAKTRGCDMNVQYDVAWANKLPASIPLYPDARVSEAAGNNSPNCRLRVVSFASAAQIQTLIDWYYTAAIRAGYSSEHQAKDGQNILAGARAKDDSAYYIYFTKRPGGGTDVDLIASNGR
jgi:hypothetical protein